MPLQQVCEFHTITLSYPVDGRWRFDRGLSCCSLMTVVSVATTIRRTGPG
jgi:hypothetical protein